MEHSNKKYDIVVVGGGPAGLLAAGKAAMDGASVLVLEKMEKPCRKLRISGKGRCNITTTKPFDEFIEEVKPNGNFLRDALKEFFANDIISLLNAMGVATVEERGQRVFPASGKAWDVAEALIKWTKSLGVNIECHSSVTDIKAANSKVESISFSTKESRNSTTIGCSKVIIATGGKSYPLTGSTGEGHQLLANLGHTLTPLLPVLVGLNTQPKISDTKGLTLKNVKVTLISNGKTIEEEFGELEIMPYGLSGPTILKLSRNAVELLSKGKPCELEVDLKPALGPEKLFNRIERDIATFSRISAIELMRKLLPSEMAFFVLEETGIGGQKVASRLSKADIENIRDTLKRIVFKVKSSRGWDEAIITAGGVSLKEVNPKTMESNIVKGLYIVGETLDLDGPTGGYNLQIAYSTGWLAGKSAAHEIRTNEK
jgi:predicted Rossmann fold flavoprotein